MADTTIIVVAAFLELVIEMVIDACALDIEDKMGVDVEQFWEMWRVNPLNTFGLHAASSLHALFNVFWAFVLLPSAYFCTTPDDPCSCHSGGCEFNGQLRSCEGKPWCLTHGVETHKALLLALLTDEIYDQFCKARSVREAGKGLNVSSNVTSNVTTGNGSDTLWFQAQNEFPSLFEILQSSSTTAIASIVVIALIVGLFQFYRARLAEAEVAEVEKEKDEIEQQRLELIEQNTRIQKELELNALNEEQVEIVHAGRAGLELQVPEIYKIASKLITFESLLGSGSFGDCYKGYFRNVAVAVKQMRVGLVNKAGFEAFAKEVIVLSTIKHVNIVSFIGYSLEPTLLIVMEFVNGGTLSSVLAAQGLTDRLSFKASVKILLGSARAFNYLHAMEPLPILHRDIKSENILISKDFEPRVADLGEARVMAENATMTIVGTQLYTAPEVLRSEHYGTPADVFSFAIVMSEVVTHQPPYSDMMSGPGAASLGQIVEMTKPPSSIRPTLPHVLSTEMQTLIQDCWNAEPSLRPSFSTICTRLKMMVKGESFASRASLQTSFSKLLLAGTSDSNAENMKRAEAVELCKNIHQELLCTAPALWDEGAVAALVRDDAKITAFDPVLHSIVGDKHGTEAVRACGQLMMGVSLGRRDCCQART